MSDLAPEVKESVTKLVNEFVDLSRLLLKDEETKELTDGERSATYERRFSILKEVDALKVPQSVFYHLCEERTTDLFLEEHPEKRAE